MINLLAFLLVIGVCVIIHEGGHYFAAVWRGVQVHEFSIGMGPRVVSKRRNGTLWSLKCFPIGGSVRLEGMEDEPLPEDEPDPARAFPIKRAWERFIIIAGGALSNIILAWVLTSVLLAGYGVLDISSPVIGGLMDGYPAADMGAKPGDRVISINGNAITEWPQIRTELQNIKTDEVRVVVERDGSEITLQGEVPYRAGESARLWGVQPSRVKYAPARAIFGGLGYCWRMSVAILASIWQMITGQLPAELAGPVGIAVMAGDAARDGFWTFISFLAVINLNLGLLNMMPFPALDGGRLFFLLGEMISGHKFPEKWENRVHIVGLAMLLALIAFVTWKDIVRLMG